MMPLFDMMRQAQNGEAMRQMARQFGLSEAQVDDAFAALAPAFSAGLKQNAAAPQPMAEFLQALSGGHHQRYFEDMQAAFSPQGVAEGNGILDHLFGSKELSRQVAAQAAQATGIGNEVLKQMLPVMASMIMGGLYKQAMGQMGSQTGATPGSPTGNVLGDIMTEMMRRSTGGQPTARSGTPNPFGEMMETMFGSRRDASAQPSAKSTNPFADNPFGKMFEQMMGAGRPSDPERVPEPDPDVMPSGRKRNPYDDLFGPMFEAGREVQSGYQKSIESIFDQYRRNMKNHM